MSLKVCSKSFCQVAGPEAKPKASLLYMNDPPPWGQGKGLMAMFWKDGHVEKGRAKVHDTEDFGPMKLTGEVSQ